MTAIYGMMAMMPALFATAGYVLVSSAGTAETAARSHFRGLETAAEFRDL